MSRAKMGITIIFFSVCIFCFGNFLAGGGECLAEDVGHVVISEIQIGGTVVADEFIELYNPTNAVINLSAYSIQYKGGTAESFKKKNFKADNIIPSFGFFLIANSKGIYNKVADLAHSTFSLSGNGGTVFLVNDQIFLTAGDETTIIDKVAYGTGTLYFEGAAIEKNPEANQSLERKIVGGAIRDTNNNYNDFEIQEIPNPQNSSSIIETDDSNNVSEAEEDAIIESNDGGKPTPSPSQEGNGGDDDFDVIITELVPNPEDDDKENEFIEIYNRGNIAADISGWTMEDKLGKTKQFTFPESAILSPKEYRVFYRPETKITLNNSGDGAILRNSIGKIISETDESGPAMDDWSWSRNKNNEWEWSLTPTPKEENQIETGEEPPLTPPSQGGEKKETSLSQGEEGEEREFDFSDEIMISEIFPNPEGRDNQDGNYEWIELYNSSDRKINLRGWQVDDLADGGSRPYFIEDDLEIPARAYLTLDYSRTKVVLNNDGDEVNLLDPNGKVISKVVYEKDGKEGWSRARDENNLLEIKWDWSDSPTPGKENKLKPPLTPPSQGGEKKENPSSQGGEEKIEEEYSESNPQEISITEAKRLARYSWVKIKGTVSAPTGVFGERTIYLSGSGIQIYSHQEDLPDLKTGDVIEITGRVSEIGGEKRILLSQADDLKVVGYQKEPEPLIILTGEAGEPIEGYLAAVEGQVTQTSGNVFYLDDGSGEVKIYIKPSTGIKKPKIKKGDWMAVTGQVSRTSAGYRILPRFQSDVRLGRVSGVSANLAETGNSLIMVILILAGVIVFGDWIRIRKLGN